VNVVAAAWWESTALRHAEADAACGRNWDCTCGHCQEARRNRESGTRPGAIARFLASLPANVTPAEARAVLREDSRLYKYNAATLGACLRALRARGLR
jgi:hypothetical protein